MLEETIREYRKVLRFIEEKLGGLFGEIPQLVGPPVQIIDGVLTTNDIREMLSKVNKVLNDN